MHQFPRPRNRQKKYISPSFYSEVASNEIQIFPSHFRAKTTVFHNYHIEMIITLLTAMLLRLTGIYHYMKARQT